MKLTEFLQPENIRQGVICTSKKRVLEVLGNVVASHVNQTATEQAQTASAKPPTPLCPIACFSRLFQREKLGSTALNQGVALPHTKLPEGYATALSEPIAVFLQLDTAVDFEAADHREVDLIYALFFPAHLCTDSPRELEQENVYAESGHLQNRIQENIIEAPRQEHEWAEHHGHKEKKPAYKQGLAELAERLSDKNLLKHLRAANSAEEIWQVLAYADKHYGESNE